MDIDCACDGCGDCGDCGDCCSGTNGPGCGDLCVTTAAGAVLPNSGSSNSSKGCNPAVIIVVALFIVAGISLFIGLRNSEPDPIESPSLVETAKTGVKNLKISIGKSLENGNSTELRQGKIISTKWEFHFGTNGTTLIEDTETKERINLKGRLGKDGEVIGYSLKQILK